MTKGKGSETGPDNPAVQYEALEELARALVREVESMEGELAVSGGERGGGQGFDFSEAVRRFETDLILWALRQTGGHQRRAARLLEMKVTTLNAKIRRYGIPSDRDSRVGVETPDSTPPLP